MLFFLLLLGFNIWNLYNIPIVAVGVRDLLRDKKKRGKTLLGNGGKLPTVSIIVPAKNEEKVIGRLLQALLRLDYPSEKKEIIVVNDGSTDRTGQICSEYASHHQGILVLQKPTSTTKAAALNFGLQHARGEIVAIFDADSVPELDTLLKVAERLKNSSVAAVQGRICSINADENMLTKFLSYEEAFQFEAYTRGKDILSLYVGLAGSCQFIRRRVLEEIGGWNEEALTEDMEMSLRLVEKDHDIRYASEVRCWEERPSSFLGLMRQRARWFRGSIEVGLKYGKLLKRFSRKRFDAEMTLFGTYMIILCVSCYFMAISSFLVPSNVVLTLAIQVLSLFTVITLFMVGVALIYVTKPLKMSNLVWLPFVYVYWGIQSFVALYALLQVVLRRPRKWSKTPRTGAVTAKQVNEILAKS